MRVGFIADVHVANHGPFGGQAVGGVNHRADQVLTVLESAALAAQEDGCDLLVVAGDLFDSVLPPPQLVARTQAALGRFRGRMSSDPNARPVVVFPGNHDLVSSHPDDHAVGPLGPVCGVVSSPKVIEGVGGRVLLVPFRTGPAATWLREDVRMLTSGLPKAPTLLCCHVGIIGPDTPAFLRDAHDAITVEQAQRLMLEFGLTAIASGHWHRRQFYNRGTIMQIGALVPPSARDDGMEGYGTFGVWDTANVAKAGGLEFGELPGPRFVACKGLAAIDAAATSGETSECAVYARASVSLNDLERARELGAALVRVGRLAGCAVTADEGEVRTSARSAAAGARSAGTLQDALGRFVAAMPLNPGIDRGNVLARSREYLGKAGG